MKTRRYVKFKFKIYTRNKQSVFMADNFSCIIFMSSDNEVFGNILCRVQCVLILKFWNVMSEIIKFIFK